MLSGVDCSGPIHKILGVRREAPRLAAVDALKLLSSNAKPGRQVDRPTNPTAGAIVAASNRSGCLVNSTVERREDSTAELILSFQGDDTETKRGRQKEKKKDSEIWPRDPMTNAFRGLGKLNGIRRSSNQANAVCRHLQRWVLLTLTAWKKLKTEPDGAVRWTVTSTDGSDKRARDV